ncbi:bifunctional serine/threonine protein kinase/MFS transporter [Streptomyces sp. DH8]|uniref:bifunctional serine/threonine protein kinase/MFS transporter n=1 Tax=Streptomyces sp. DH8 TaxID=2857008 RepID=UPI0027DFB211|nr:bifunctional serine/threonine protein kinase/MFS transporter [Streptomyces sp. DH8]
MDQLTGQDPDRIGPYHLMARLGKGGMGLVYIGRSDLGRTVAVKVVQAEYAQDPQFRARFAREVASARRVGGEFTAAVLDADTEAVTPWVATQYIPAPDLSAVVRNGSGPLPERSVRTLANRLALALHDVHEAGLLHRDLKPGNVLITVDGPRLIDFGIARALERTDDAGSLTVTGMLVGSPGFMSPEQARGGALTRASDLFCLGEVLVYAATGRLLFGAGQVGLHAHLFQVAEEEPDLAGVPDSLLDLVRDCLHKDPAQRPTTAQVVERTATERAGEWLPAQVLAHIARKAAELSDFVPEARNAKPDPRVQAVAPSPDPPASPPYPSPPPASPPYPLPPPAPPSAHRPVPPPAPPGAVSVSASASAPAPSGPAGHGASSDTRRWWGLAVAASAHLVVLYNTASLLGLLPGMARDLGGWNGLAWLEPGYVVAFGALLLVGGHLVDLVGSRKTLLIGLTGFTVAAVAGASAAGPAALVWSHGLQGVFAALIAPASLGLATTLFTEPKHRRQAIGVYSVVGLGGSVLILFIAAPLALTLTWRASAYLVALLALLALAGAAALVRERPDRAPARFDVPGALLSTLGVAALLQGFDSFLADDRGVPLAATAVLVGVLLLALFVRRQSRTANPILSVHAAGGRELTGASLVLFLTALALGIMVPRLGVYLLFVGPSAPLVAFPVMAAVFLAGSLGVSTRLLPRVAPRVLLLSGLLLAAIGALLVLPATGSLVSVLPSTVCLGLGLGAAGAVLYSTITDGVDARASGGLAGFVLVNQHVGGALGITLVYVMTSHHVFGGNPGPVYGAAGALAVAALLGRLLVKGPARAVPSAGPRPAPGLSR